LCRIEIIVIFAIGEKENFLRYITRTVIYGNVIGYTGLCGQHVFAKHQVYHFEHVWDGDAKQPIHTPRQKVWLTDFKKRNKSSADNPERLSNLA